MFQLHICFSSLSESWYEPSWAVNCGPNLIWLIVKEYAQIVSDVFVDFSDVSKELLTGLSSLAIAKTDC
jgi:hypothetical protein